MAYDHPLEPENNGLDASTKLAPPSRNPKGGLAPNRYRREGFTAAPPAGRVLDSKVYSKTPFTDLTLYFPTLTSPVAGYDGAFNAGALITNPFGVICILLPYLDQTEFDFISLRVNDTQVDFHTVTEDEAAKEQPIVLFINSARFIDQANNTVQAFVTRLGGGDASTKLFNMFVDRQPPVGDDPIYSTTYNDNMAALKFTDPQIEAFGVITQEQATLGVEMEIANYPLDRNRPNVHWRKEGDVIVVSIGGTLISHSVTAFEAAGDDPIRFTAYYGTWEKLIDGVHIAEWDVRDKVGNISPGFSAPRLIQLDRGTGESLLPGVFVVESEFDVVRDMDVIDTRTLTDDATVELPIRSLGYQVGDTVIVTVRGLSADGTATVTTIEHPVTSITPIRVYLPLDLDFLLALSGGRILITYKRVRTGAPDRSSQGVLYAIDGDPVEDGLAAPLVQDLIDGALPADTNPVRIVVPRYLGQNGNDRVDLTVTGLTADGRPVFATYTDMAGIGDVLFELENAFFAELDGGYFVAFYEVNGSAQRPPSKSVTVPVGDAQAVLPAPWTLQAGPPDFTFDPAVSLANLNVRIDPHPVIVEGSEVRLIAIGSKPGGSFTSEWFKVDINWEDSVIPLTIARLIVLANLNDTMRLYYEVKPASPGASSLFSRDLIINVGMALKLPIPPLVLEATSVSPTEAELNPLHVLPPSPIIVTIRVRYDGMLASDDVTVHIVGMPGLGEPVIPSKPGVPDAGENYITFTSLSNFVAAYLGGFCEIYYTVKRGGNTVQSKELTLRVTALPSNALDLVSVPEASASNVISVNATNNVQIQRWPFFKSGQAVFIELVHTTGDRTLRDGKVVSTTEFSAGRTLDLIPGDYLKPLPNNSTLTINAKVSLDGSNLESTAVSLGSRTYTLSSVPALTIPDDTRVVNLGGWLLLGFGNNERVYLPSTRTASGGKTPYTYRTNSAAVYVDTRTGEISINSSGTATITVTDSSTPAQTASYQVQVNGAYSICRYIGQAPWINANATGPLPYLSTFRSLRTRFGSNWPRRTNAWAKEEAPDQQFPGVAYHYVNVWSGDGLIGQGSWSGANNHYDVLIIS